MNCTAKCPAVPHFHLFGISDVAITYYATIILSGMIAAFLIIGFLFKRRNISVDLALTYFCVGLPVALVTTRLFSCITTGLPIQLWFDWNNIRHGGLSIIGGIIGGTAAVAGISALKKVNFLRVGDCIVVGLLFAQAVGRWGNFINGEVYGWEILNPALQWFPLGVLIGNKWHYAFFFYESTFNLLLAGALFVNGWLNDKKPNGVNTALYFIGYGLVRTIMEPLRSRSFILGADTVPWSLVFAIVMLVGGTALLVYLLINNKKKEGKIFGSAVGEESGIVTYIAEGKDDEAYFSKINMMCKKHPENYKEKPKKEKKQ